MKKFGIGCLTISGIIMTVVGIGGVISCIVGMVASEESLDRKRAEYTEWSKDMMAYEEDSVKTARYAEIDSLMNEAELAGDSLKAAELRDSLELYAPPPQRGVIGFNIAGAFLMVPLVVCGVIGLIGIVLLIIGIVMGRKAKPHP